MRNNHSIINVYKKKNVNSEVVTQLLYGDEFKKINQEKNWIKIKNNLDNYIGYVKYKKFYDNQKKTHKISSSSAKLYSKPNSKYKTKLKIYFSSRIMITEKSGNFFKFDKFWVYKKNIKKINFKTKQAFENVKKFLNTKYKWGGKSSKGIDCSALVQLFVNFNNKYCPRDAKDQIKFFKKSVKLSNIKKNDLLFWKGHVAIALSKKKLIHAYGPAKKVVIMPINKTIKIIKKTAKLDLISIKRI